MEGEKTMAFSPPLPSPISHTFSPRQPSSFRHHKTKKLPPPSDPMSSYRDMLANGVPTNCFTFPPLLKFLADQRAFLQGAAVHTHLIKTGFLSNNYAANNLLRLYTVCSDICSARKLFDRIRYKDLVSWTTLISGYAKTGLAQEAVGLFFEMTERNMVADEWVMATVLSACAKLGDMELGRKLETYISVNNVAMDICALNALLNMFLKCADMDTARKVFRRMPERSIVTWNSMISGLSRNGRSSEALSVFRRMQGEGLEPDEATLAAVLNSCADLGALELGQWVHVYIDKKGIKADGIIGNVLVDMYAKCGGIGLALGVFVGMDRRDVYSYTAMVVGFAMHGQGEKALDLFTEMSRVGIRPNGVTFVGVLSACSHAGLVEMGIRHFEDMSRLYGILPRIEHYGCMVDMFSRAGLLDEALEFVERMPIEPDAFIWGALLGACKIYGNVALAEHITEILLDLEPERDGSYVLMSNIYASADHQCNAIQVRKAMKTRKVKKTPGCSIIEVGGVVHEFRMGDKSHPQATEIYSVVNEIVVRLRDEE